MMRRARLPSGTFHESALRQVLRNGDLLCLIFAEFDVTGCSLRDSTFAKKILLQIALTCKAFLDPALNVIWKTQYSLRPLLMLLGYDYSTFQPLTIPEGNWQRFGYYARKVRQLTIVHDDGGPFSDWGPITLCRSLQVTESMPQYMVPTLKELRVLNCTWERTRLDVDNLSLWLSPFLEIVKPEFDASLAGEGRLGAALTALANQAPGVRRLEIHGNGIANHLHLLSSFKTLTHIRLTLPNISHLYSEHGVGVRATVLEELSRCSSLEILEMLVAGFFSRPALTSWMDTQRALTQAKPVHFPNLRALVTRGDPPWLLWSLTQLSGTLPNLTSIYLEVCFDFGRNVYNNIEVWDSLLETLTKCPDLSTVVFGSSTPNDSLDYYDMKDYRDLYTINLATVLRSLRQSRLSLRNIVINKSLFVECDGATPGTIANDFPQLQAIRLPDNSYISRERILRGQMDDLLARFSDWAKPADFDFERDFRLWFDSPLDEDPKWKPDNWPSRFGNPPASWSQSRRASPSTQHHLDRGADTFLPFLPTTSDLLG